MQSARPDEAREPATTAEARLDEILSECEPYDESPGESAEQREAELARMQDEAVRVLTESDNAEHLVAAARFVYRKDPRRSFKLLSEAAELAPDNAYVSWSRLKFCAMYETECGEDSIEISRLAVANEPGNAAVWANVAHLDLSVGREVEALDALERAAAAPYLDTYIADEAMMFDRALAASTDLPSRDRFEHGWVWAISILDGTTSLGQRCREFAASSIQWREACLRFHEQLSHHGKTYLAMMIGLAVQSKMHEYSSNETGQRRIEAERTTVQAHLDSGRLNLLDKIVIRDEALFRAYAEVFKNDGEMAALDYVEEELLRLSADPDYDPCGTNGKE